MLTFNAVRVGAVEIGVAGVTRADTLLTGRVLLAVAVGHAAGQRAVHRAEVSNEPHACMANRPPYTIHIDIVLPAHIIAIYHLF